MIPRRRPVADEAAPPARSALSVRWNRQSMRTQTAIILVIAFVLSHLLGLLIYARDRDAALETADIYDVAERAAGISVLLRNLPAAWRADVVAASDSRTFRVWSSEVAALPAGGTRHDEADLLAYLRSMLPRLTDREIRLRIVGELPDGIEPPERPSIPPAGGEKTAAPGAPAVIVSVHHPDGSWINFVGYTTAAVPVLPVLLWASLSLTAVVIALVAFWLVHRVTQPLSRLSAAADRLGRNIDTEPLDAVGPAEVVQAARAFNRMQGRLSRLLATRTELLAAISHDLRTPITQMRLRTELSPRSPERRKTLEALDEMEAIVLTFLDYAGAVHSREDRQRIDLGALIESICADRKDAGADVECDVQDGLRIQCKRLALKRALGNLVDNALKYGRRAAVRARRNDGEIVITVEDEGPGIPDSDLEAVFAPFYRGSPSRSSKIGGVGLGLSIAQAIAQDHGGDVRLANRNGKGLRAQITLPA